MAKKVRGRNSEFFAEGPSAIVFAYADFEKDLGKAKAKDAAKVIAILKNHYCENGSVRNSEKWNPNEGTYTVGHEKHRVQAVKSFQVRVYGVEGSFLGKRAFFVSAVDPAKQTNKADRGLLQRAVNGAVKLVANIRGAKL